MDNNANASNLIAVSANFVKIMLKSYRSNTKVLNTPSEVGR